MGSPMSQATIRKCWPCHLYTLQETCPTCGAPTRTPHPARFSPADPYARYRRALLAEIRVKN